MYCKYCGKEIPDDSVYCAKCGKQVVESITSPDIEIPSLKNNISSHWQFTENVQWKKPILARVIQLLSAVVFFLFFVYSLSCLINGGKIDRTFGQCKTLSTENPGTPYFLETRQYEENLVIQDDYELLKVKKQKWNRPRTYSIYGEEVPWAFSYDEIKDAQYEFREKVLLAVFIPSLLLFIIVANWARKLKFPNSNNGLPRDFADEIEKYEYFGFTKHKYVFFKKNGKYGIIDVVNYCVIVPAQYDSLLWREPNKIYDATIGDERFSLSIPQKSSTNPNFKNSPIRSLGKTICVLLTLFTFFTPLISLLLHDESSKVAILCWFFTSFILAIITYLLFKNSSVK